MENLNLKCSESIQLDKILSLPGIFPDDPIQYQGRDVKVDFDRIQFGDTPIMMDNHLVGVVPKRAVQTSGGRVRASHGKFTSENFAGFIGEQIQTGAVIEPLEFDGDILTKGRLKSFTVQPSGRSYRPGSHNHQYQSGSDDALSESLFQASSGGPSPVTPDREPPQRKITSYGRTPAADNDDDIAQMIFDSSRGQDAEPNVPQGDPPRRQEGKADVVGSGYPENRAHENEAIDDDALAEQLFQAGGGA